MDWQPEQVWKSVRQRVREWMGVEDVRESQSNEDEADPTLLFHLSISAPLLIALLMLMRRGVAP
jgi:hypothetical protein